MWRVLLLRGIQHTSYAILGTESVVDDQILDYCSLDEQVSHACHMCTVLTHTRMHRASDHSPKRVWVSWRVISSRHCGYVVVETHFSVDQATSWCTAVLLL